MIVSLPMYDRPETRDANNRLWAGIRGQLAGAGIDAPQQLSRTADPWQHWLSPDLFLSQTCGLPFRASLHADVKIVGTPVSFLNCPAGHYFSVLIARRSDSRQDSLDFSGARLAFNEPGSQSGWAAVSDYAKAHGLAFSQNIQTGSHRNSARAVAEQKADFAAIDAITWGLITRFDPWAAALKVVGQTAPTPALPYITATHHDTDVLFRAISGAIDALTQADQLLLSLQGLAFIPPAHYRALPIPDAPV